MVFQSSSGIENNRNIQLYLSLLFFLLIFLFFIHSRANRPNKDEVNGIYRNKCCNDIIINGRQLSYGSITVNMKLLNMKFGLTGYVVEDIDGAVAALAKLDKLYRPSIRSRFEERFSARAMAREYVKIYESLVAQGVAPEAVKVAAE